MSQGDLLDFEALRDGCRGGDGCRGVMPKLSDRAQRDKVVSLAGSDVPLSRLCDVADDTHD
jgi:hypothetical protein